MNQFLDKPLTFDFQNYNKILILGLGGGCDIISAYSAQFLFDFLEDTEIIYGNTKRGFDNDLEPITPHICKLPPKQIDLGKRPISSMRNTWIDRSIPRGYGGCPYIFRCKKRNSEQLTRDIESLGFDLVIGVDAGGDAIIEGAISGSRGRDKEMVKILTQTEMPFMILILGPGCDGESNESQILHSFTVQEKNGKYLGFCSLEPLIPHFEKRASKLGRSRTPNIIKQAFHGELPLSEDRKMIISRGIYPHISKAWLIHGFAFGLY
ncbi:MAG: DUF1152 domain-containing protein [Promethearchaeia archaeon]